MASDNEATCEGDPNFAVICAFLEKFGATCGLNCIDFPDLQNMLEDTHEVAPTLIDLHIKLLRKIRKSVSTERWERAIINICHGYNTQDAWEIERFGYKNSRIASKLRILKQLLEMQFDLNVKFKNEINKMSATELRSEPLGRDQTGHAYWFQTDQSCQIRVYKEDPDEETWELVAKDRDGLVALIAELGSGDGGEPIVNEDSNSLEIDKPILDTGQNSDSSKSTKKSSEEDESSDTRSSEIKETSPVDTDEKPLNESENENRQVRIYCTIKRNSKSEPNDTIDETKKPLQAKTTDKTVSKDPELLESSQKISDVKNVDKKIEACDKMEGDIEDVNIIDNQESNINKREELPSEEELVAKNIENTQSSIETSNKSNELPVQNLSLKLDESKKDASKIEYVCLNLSKNTASTEENIEKKEQSAKTGQAKHSEKSSKADETKPLSLRLKPLNELLSPDIEKKIEFSGIKEKYIRSEPVPSQASNRKAVESAGFAEIYKNEFKRHINYDVEEPSIIKRPRMDRPTLLGRKKVPKPYEEDEDDYEEESNVEVSEEIEEPLMLVKGRGSGESNNCENIKSPIISEEITEEVFMVYGEGNGFDCETGNEKEEAKCEGDNTENQSNTVLETVTDSKSNIRCPPKKTKWDKSSLNENTSSKIETQESIESNNEEPKKTSFFFGPGSGFTFKTPNVSPAKSNCVDSDDNLKSDNLESKQISITDSDQLNTKSGSENEETLTLIVDKIDSTNVNLNKNEMKETNNDVTENDIFNSTKENIITEAVPSVADSNLDDNLQKSSNDESDSGLKTIEKNDSLAKINDNVPINKVEESSTLTITESSVNKPTQNNLNDKIIDSEKLANVEDNISTSNCLKSSNENIIKTNSIKDEIEIKPIALNTETMVTTSSKITEVTKNDSMVLEDKNSPPAEKTLTNEEENQTEVKVKPIGEKLIEEKQTTEKQIEEEPAKEKHTKDKQTEEKKSKEKIAEEKQSKEKQIEQKQTKEKQIEEKQNKEKQIEEKQTKEKQTEEKQSEGKLQKKKRIPKKVSKTGVNKLVTNVEDEEIITIEDETKVSEDELNGLITKTKGKETEKVQAEIITRRSTRVRNKEGEQLQANTSKKKIPKNNLNNKNVPNKVIENLAGKKSQNTNKVGKKGNNESILEEKQNKADTDSVCISKLKESKGKDNSNLEENKEESKISSNKKEVTKAKNLADDFNKDTEATNVAKFDIKKIEINMPHMDIPPDIDDMEEQILDEVECSIKKSKEVKEKPTKNLAFNETKDEIEDKELPKEETVKVANKKENTEDQLDKNIEDLNSENKTEPKNISLTAFSLDFTESSKDEIQEVIKRVTRKRNKELEEESHEEGKKLKNRGKRKIDTKLRKSIEEKKNKNRSSSDEDPSAQGHPSRSPSPIEKSEKRKEKKKKKRLLLGLEIPDTIIDDSPIGVRQSRRIAQIKIKEEAERRKLEEVTLQEIKHSHSKKSKKDHDKDFKVERKKKEKLSSAGEDEETTNDVDDDKKKKKKKRKRKNKLPNFNHLHPWKSSSDSNSSTEGAEDEEEEEYEDDEVLVFKSDHEFSPESDLENEEAQPLKRARTVKKEDAIEEDIRDDTPCQKCEKFDHPEWILLCDGCDAGWHCSCLRPALLVIPEGDWYCPPCQHTALVKNLQERLKDYDIKVSKREIELRRKQRLAYVGISLDNVLPTKDHDDHKNKHKMQKQRKSASDSGSEESESGSESSSVSSSDSEDEPIYQLRRRQAHSYRFNQYDELINSAIQEEVESVQQSTVVSKGKDIENIVNAESPKEALPPVVPTDTDLPPVLNINEDNSDEDEVIKPVRKLIGKKKHRKLNSLDISSGDDDNSDEDFRGTSSDEEEDDDFDEELGTDSSELDGRRKKRGPVRRSTRARISRYDRDFINDDSDDEPPKRKSRYSWDESESEESDGSWKRRRKRNRIQKPSPSSSIGRIKKSSKKKKKNTDESDEEVFRRKKPKIKFGGLDSDKEEEGRRTRGKKINYMDVLGTDSEDEARRKNAVQEESEDEFVLHEEEPDDDVERDSDDSGDGVIVSAGIKSHSKKGVGKGGIKRIKRAQGDVEDELFPPLEPKEAESKSETEKEPNPIEQINKNIENLNEEEMELMMEEESYANMQLQMMAEQLEKEKRRKEMEARRLMGVIPAIVPPPVHLEGTPMTPVPISVDEKTPKKRGRKPKALTAMSPVLQQHTVSPVESFGSSANIDKMGDFGEAGTMLFNPDGTPKKRRGRGKGKKTLEKEAAAAAILNSSGEEKAESPVSAENKLLGSPSLIGGKLGIASAPQPFSLSQPKPSVITRMLQNQPNQPPFPLNAMNHKYYPEQGVPPQMIPGGPNPNFGLRGIPPGFRPGVNHYSPRGLPPSSNMRGPPPKGIPPQMYHQHLPGDPSPSGGGQITLSERSSPSLNSPSSASPASNKSDPTPTPPPPPYVRPPLSRFPPMSSGPPIGSVTGPSSTSLPSSSPMTGGPPMVTGPPITSGPPMTNAPPSSTELVPPPGSSPTPVPTSNTSTLETSAPPISEGPPILPHPHLLPPLHLMQQRPPYHPGLPTNYPYPYPGPAPTEDEDSPENQYHAPPYQQFPAEPGVEGQKNYDEENGEFGGLVSYFSSQREDDLDT